MSLAHKPATLLALLCVAGWCGGCQDIPYEVKPVVGDNAKNFELAFHALPPTNIVILHSIVYRYETLHTVVSPFPKDRHDPDWEFELIVPRAWFEEQKVRLKFASIQRGDPTWDPREIAPDWRAPWFAPGSLSQYDVWQSGETIPPCCHILVPRETAPPGLLRLFYRKD